MSQITVSISLWLKTPHNPTQYFQTTLSIFNGSQKILDSPCILNPWIKPGAQKILFQPALNKTFSPMPRYSPPTIKALKTPKVTKLNFLPLFHWYLTEGLQYKNWKGSLYSPITGSDFGPLELNSDLLTIRPLNYVQCD